jgi:hypothetical protein
VWVCGWGVSLPPMCMNIRTYADGLLSCWLLKTPPPADSPTGRRTDRPTAPRRHLGPRRRHLRAHAPQDRVPLRDHARPHPPRRQLLRLRPALPHAPPPRGAVLRLRGVPPGGVRHRLRGAQRRRRAGPGPGAAAQVAAVRAVSRGSDAVGLVIMDSAALVRDLGLQPSGCSASSEPGVWCGG